MSLTRSQDSATEKERKFYRHYFGHLREDLSLFFDPLKKRLRNRHFRSISREYLAQLRKSEIFCNDLEEYCKQQMVYRVLEQYPAKLLARFRENPQFLVEMDRNKSKFDWIKFELVAAIYHFLFVFDTADQKVADIV